MFAKLLRKFHDWRLRHYTRRRLSQLDDRLLADIGTERDCLDDFVWRYGK